MSKKLSSSSSSSGIWLLEENVLRRTQVIDPCRRNVRALKSISVCTPVPYAVSALKNEKNALEKRTERDGKSGPASMTTVASSSSSSLSSSVAARWTEAAGRYRNEYLASVAATLCIFMVVCTNAWTSPALPKLLTEPNPPISITADDGSWIMAIQALGGIPGMLIGGLTVDRYGRKWPFIGSAGPVIAGWILMATARSTVLLYVARFLFGVSYGVAYSIAPIYLGEIASADIRGTVGTFITAMAKVAFMFEYSIGPYVSFEALAWISLTGVALFLATFPWMPESPHFLLATGRYAEALASLRWLRRRPDVEDELVAIKKSIDRMADDRRMATGRAIRDLFVPAYRHHLVLVLILAFGMQLTGAQAILGYAQTIFGKISTDLTPAEMSIVLGAVQLVTVLFPILLVDRLGRRPIMLWSTGGCTAGLLLGSVYFTLDAIENVRVGSYGWVSFVGLVVFVVMYAFGLATVPFAILSEIFPRNIRASANALYGVLSAILIFGVVKLFQVAADAVGVYLPFWVFTGCTAITFVLVYLYLPETKGKSLEEVDALIAGQKQSQSPSTMSKAISRWCKHRNIVLDFSSVQPQSKGASATS
ncbi:facilitated trehalose transporter Tret1-like [Anopheles darlingi]|uniref:facilitated trehalose transporter Tret1-like n=1 Tax=Anopheles darlingi TaxID=43151 RepID=UPI0021001CBB|nr:facilitated trehalose transporter Tret1-like [Anopheles darlingi]